MDAFLSKRSTRQRIDPATEDKQRDLETRLEELKLLVERGLNGTDREPVAGTGMLLYDAAIGADIEQAVEASKTYRVTASITGGFLLGIADVTNNGNVLWVCPLAQSILIKIPLGVTTLHYQADTNGAYGRLVEVV